MKDKCKYWLELSDYDIGTAEAMLKTKRFLYVGFMCHQAVEKILKAYYNKVYDEPAPYTHNLFFWLRNRNLRLNFLKNKKT